MTTHSPPTPLADYAYVPVAHYLSQPLRIHVLGSHGPDHSDVLVYHPDAPPETKMLANVLITDEWFARPGHAMWPGYQGERSWAQIAEQTYQQVQEERDLARRLTDLGISRRLRHYAGVGGTSHEAGEADTQLTFSHDELDYLLTLAERGKEGGTSATQEST